MSTDVPAESHDVRYKWPPLESDPEIFTNYMASMGLPAQWAFSELMGFDDDLLSFVQQPVLAVVLNAEYTKKRGERPQGDADATGPMFYMKQTAELDNACGVIAALHAVYNNLGDADAQVALSPESVLGRFHAAIAGKTPEERATALESYDAFKQEYRKVAEGGQSSRERGTAHHYTAFVVNAAGELRELCGCKEGPLLIEANCTDVLKGAAKEILRRVNEGEITHSLSVMALNTAV